jgi:L-Lysine epsilon oxidase N-terminal/L-lysine epsilon oxidase C-terminal domain
MPKRFEIHPAIGIARVGRSQEFFIGPEPDGQPPSLYRDNNGELKRQAARFRVFECERDAAGRLVSATEITTERAEIEWTVHLVNRKAAAPNFLNEMQIVNTDLNNRRNNATGNDDQDRDLIIDPGPANIKQPGQVVALDAGKFKGVPVPLGGLQMQPDGRLLVLGGFGTSRSITPSGAPESIRSFADNDTWHDDVADGPVQAKITFKSTGETATATQAWVIVTPPDYAPEISNLITLYDVLSDLAVTRGVLPAPPAKPSFEKHVKPILNRVLGYQWVNREARRGYDGHQSGGHGPDGPGNFARMMDALSDPATGQAQRQQIAKLLRDPKKASSPLVPKLKRMPRLNDHDDTGDVLPLTPTQYQILQAWGNGQFVTSDPGDNQPELLPDDLDRVALQACSGGPFFPGIEAGRVMRDATRFTDGEPFRLTDDRQILKPGGVTERNALPWQADYLLCRWEGGKNLGWWPAQRPDDVFPKNDPDHQVRWARNLGESFEDMVEKWHLLGIVVKETGSNGEIFVETERKLAEGLGPGA